LIAWIKDRDAREKALLAGAAVILLLAGLWAAVWEPLDNRLSQFQARVTQQQAIYLQLQQLAAEAEQLGSGSASVADRGDQSLLSLADRSVRAAGLAGALRSGGLNRLVKGGSGYGCNRRRLIPWQSGCSRLAANTAFTYLPPVLTGAIVPVWSSRK
jgi:hypothetical protein